MNLNQVSLPARDVAESAAFFRSMGFAQIVASSHYARFSCPSGDATFSLHEAEKFSVNPNFVVYFETEHLDVVVSQLESKGLSFYQRPRDEPWLWREARLTDPSGNIICLYSAGENRKNPPWRVQS